MGERWRSGPRRRRIELLLTDTEFDRLLRATGQLKKNRSDILREALERYLKPQESARA